MATGKTLQVEHLRPVSLNYFGLLGPRGENFGQLIHLVKNIKLEPRRHLDLEFVLANVDEGAQGPLIDVQVVEAGEESGELDVSLKELPKADDPNDYRDTDVSTWRDDWEEGVGYESLLSTDLHEGTRYRVRLLNRDPSMPAEAALKVIITEKPPRIDQRAEREHLPKSFDEVMRVKPKISGLKESAFIQGSKSVMKAFQVASLTPFVPKSQEVYQGSFKTGRKSDDTFMHSLDFEVTDRTSQIYAQVFEYSGREDLFMTVYASRVDDGEEYEVARSSLGKYANALGPATLTKGKYRLVVHPDQESTAMQEGRDNIRFGLDVLLERSDIGGNPDFEVVVEEVELCNIPSLPDNFNGPGFIHQLSGNSYEAESKYRLTELLEGTAVKFKIEETSLISFYLGLPEGLRADALVERVQGTYSTRVSSEDLNKGDESFLRQQGGFQHRAVIQVREFLEPGEYMIKMQAKEATSTSVKVMPRCEAYSLGLTA